MVTNRHCRKYVLQPKLPECRSPCWTLNQIRPVLILKRSQIRKLVRVASARLASAAGCVPRPEQHCRASGYRHGEGNTVFWVSNDDNYMRDSRSGEPARAPSTRARTSATAASPERPRELQESLQRAKRLELDATGHASNLLSPLMSAKGCAAIPGWPVFMCGSTRIHVT